MNEKEPEPFSPIRLGLDMGVFSAKGVLIDHNHIARVSFPTVGKPVEAARKCITRLLDGKFANPVKIGIMGQNARLVGECLGIEPLLEIESLQTGLMQQNIKTDYLLSLGHENIYYLELGNNGDINYFSRNGQCAAGSGSFWYQQATRMGYNDQELARIAAESETTVPISGRCAVFAKSDMTHAINEGATQNAVSAGMAKALVENILSSVALNRIQGPGLLTVIGGVANNKAVLKHLTEYAEKMGIKINIPVNHQYLGAAGAAVHGTKINLTAITVQQLTTPAYRTEKPLPPLEPGRVCYLNSRQSDQDPGCYDLNRVFLGVDCGSVSTKCVLLDQAARQIGGVYLPTTGRPALQVLQLIREVEKRYGSMLSGVPITACTTGSGRFLSQKILNAEYAVDEITCQAAGIKHLFPDQKILSIIEIGGEDSKFIQLREGTLFDYNMNPVCAAGTGTFLENLAELLGVSIKDEFSDQAFSADYAVDLGDICTLISQSILNSASARGLPLNEQLASLAYSSAQNYLSKTVDKRPLEGLIVFAGATAKNHALAAALAAICEKIVYVPDKPELTGALGSALMARQFYRQGQKSKNSFSSLDNISDFSSSKKPCRAECKHEHSCVLNIIKFADGKKFIYGDRCGRYSGLDRQKADEDGVDYALRRAHLFAKAAGKGEGGSPNVGIARAGLYFEYYPFWSTFFSELGCSLTVTADTSPETLQKGKVALDSEMCYPMKVIIGHYSELKNMNPDYIFVPEVVNTEALPWADQWPRSFVCPLLQTLRGTVQNSLAIDDDQLLYAQLNYRAGYSGIRDQMRPLALKILGRKFNEKRFEKALKQAYKALERYKENMVRVSEEIFRELKQDPTRVTAVILSRSYTLYDEFISKRVMHYASICDITPVPQEYLFLYLQYWFDGDLSSSFLDPFRAEFIAYLNEQVSSLENIYPAQLQRILSVVMLVNFLNGKRAETGLPRLNIIFLDPFKCGPNAMLRHYLNGMTSYLRLTLDEHTAAAGMITRLEAFRNTCLSNNSKSEIKVISTATTSFADKEWRKILVPEPTRHADIFVSMFKRAGIEAALLPRGIRGDLSLAQRYINGEECLPFMQNVQDYLSYLNSNCGESDGLVFFQGWACGPCRYGLYAPTQSLIINRAGCGSRKVCAIRFSDILTRFGIGFVLVLFNGLFAIDLLYKMLHKTRPYELKAGSAERLFEKFVKKLSALLESQNYSGLFHIAWGRYRKAMEKLIAEAAEDFSRLPLAKINKPRILLGGEFYVRLDDRCNQSVIELIEKAGGEVCIAPMTEVFTYTLYIDCFEARQAFKVNRRPADIFKQLAYSLMLKIAHRDEVALQKAAGSFLEDLYEPAPEEIMKRAGKYVSSHYGGEPPMTIGRVAAFAGRKRVSGAIFVAPFTCMPGSVVEALQGSLQDELNIPIISVYYDGRESANRNEMVEGLVFQARQRLKKENTSCS
jgi:predicted CoA-substrate-specific enzyme activase